MIALDLPTEKGLVICELELKVSILAIRTASGLPNRRGVIIVSIIPRIDSLVSIRAIAHKNTYDYEHENDVSTSCINFETLVGVT